MQIQTIFRGKKKKNPPYNTVTMQHDCINVRHSAVLSSVVKVHDVSFNRDNLCRNTGKQHTLFPQITEEHMAKEAVHSRNLRGNLHLRRASTSQCYCFSTGQDEMVGQCRVSCTNSLDMAHMGRNKNIITKIFSNTVPEKGM